MRYPASASTCGSAAACPLLAVLQFSDGGRTAVESLPECTRDACAATSDGALSPAMRPLVDAVLCTVDTGRDGTGMLVMRPDCVPVDVDARLLPAAAAALPTGGDGRAASPGAAAELRWSCVSFVTRTGVDDRCRMDADCDGGELEPRCRARIGLPGGTGAVNTALGGGAVAVTYRRLRVFTDGRRRDRERLGGAGCITDTGGGAGRGPSRRACGLAITLCRVGRGGVFAGSMTGSAFASVCAAALPRLACRNGLRGGAPVLLDAGCLALPGPLAGGGAPKTPPAREPEEAAQNGLREVERVLRGEAWLAGGRMPDGGDGYS